jgi:hypothetical protein
MGGEDDVGCSRKVAGVVGGLRGAFADGRWSRARPRFRREHRRCQALDDNSWIWHFC